jgi:hypothetical protein
MPKECPMCGEFMKLVIYEYVVRLPGSAKEIRSESREWVCQECDYFEEAEAGDVADGPGGA